MMSKKKFEGEMPSVIVDNLFATCDRHEEEVDYIREYSDTEMTEFREDFANKAIKLKVEKEEVDAEIKSLKARVKELEKYNNALLNTLQSGREFKTGPLYWFYDHLGGIAEGYDNTGTLVISRKLRPEERQLILRTAVNQ